MSCCDSHLIINYCPLFDGSFTSCVVVPRRSNVSTTVQHQLEGKDVAINCSLHFGSLRENWTVTWTAENKDGDTIPTSGYEIQTDPSFQLVINNATIDYDGAKFQCRAELLSDSKDSQRITLNLFCK